MSILFVEDIVLLNKVSIYVSTCLPLGIITDISLMTLQGVGNPKR